MDHTELVREVGECGPKYFLFQSAVATLEMWEYKTSPMESGPDVGEKSLKKSLNTDMLVIIEEDRSKGRAYLV